MTKTIGRLLVTCVFTLFCLAQLGAADAVKPVARPNIVLIFAAGGDAPLSESALSAMKKDRKRTR